MQIIKAPMAEATNFDTMEDALEALTKASRCHNLDPYVKAEVKMRDGKWQASFTTNNSFVHFVKE